MTLDDDNAILTLPPSRPSPGSWYVRLSSQHLIGPNLPWPPALRPARPSSEPMGRADGAAVAQLETRSGEPLAIRILWSAIWPAYWLIFLREFR